MESSSRPSTEPSQLPVEIITHIMRFLSVSDRKECGLVCKQWYESSLDPVLLKDTIVTFHFQNASNSFPHLSRRKVPNLYLDNIDGSLKSRELMLNSYGDMCESLQGLSLKGSDVSEKSLLTILSKCHNLESLDLSCCNTVFMSGQFLSNEEDVRKLKPVLKNVNELNLSSLRFLSDATFNRLTRVCSNVKKLALSGTQITFHAEAYYKGNGKDANSAILTFMNILVFISNNSTNIDSLNFSRTNIDNESLANLASVFDLSLKGLELVACKEISDSGVSILCRKQPGLKSLNISQCIELTDQSVNAICANMTLLKNLNVSKCRYVSDNSISRLRMLPYLEQLDVTACYGLSSAGLLRGLCSLQSSNLTHLILNSCSNVLDEFVKKMSTLTGHSMIHLDLRSCLHITDNSLHYISKYMKNLQVLKLAWCKEITDCGLLGISNPDEVDKECHEHAEGPCKCTRKGPSTDLFKKIHEIMPREDCNIPDLSDKYVYKALEESEVYPISNLHRMKTLDLSNLPKITDIGIRHGIKFTELQSLSMIMCQSITDKSIISIAEHVPSLETLLVSQCYTVSDVGIKTVAENLHRLSSLEISMCDKVTDVSLQSLADHSKRLHHLDVSLCENISLPALHQLETRLPNLHSVKKRLVGSTASH